MEAAVAFWIAVAAIIVAGGWFKSRSDEQKHVTLRAIIEKTGTVDEAQLRALFGATSVIKQAPGDVHVFLRVLGTVVMSTSAGLLIFFTIYRQAVSEQNGTVGLASALIVAAVGAGFFIASRFVAPPSVATRARAVD